MPPSQEQAFEKCLQALERGESIEQAVGSFPEHEQELRALLLIAQRSRRLSPAEPPRAAVMRSRTKMLARVHDLQSSPRPGFWNPLARWVMAAAVLLVFVLIGGFGLAAASAQALPGDDFYSVKRTAERIQLNLTAGKSNRLNLNIRQDMRRVEEVRRLLQLERVVEVQFEAVLDTRVGALWQFEGIPVLVTEETIVPSGLRVGDVLLITGRTTTQGWFRAYSLGAAGLTFDGRIEEMVGEQWIIGGRTLQILSLTSIETGLSRGDLVRVRARTEAEDLVALQIESIEPAATPIPTLPPAGDQVPATSIPEPTQMEDETDEEMEELEDFDITGSLEAMEASRWRVAGRWLSFNDSTDFDGDFEVGNLVRARGTIQEDGSYLAEEFRQIEATDDKPEDDSEDDSEADSDDDESDHDESDSDSEEEQETNTPEPTTTSTATPEPDPTVDSTEEPKDEVVEFEGTIESIDGNSWQISGTTVLVTGETHLDGDPQEGDNVRVKAERSSDGTLYAERIKVEN